MVATVGFNPSITTNASGSFNIQTTGYIQGTALNDPAIRNELAGGILATSETTPMWGGVAIMENIPAGITAGVIPETGTANELGGSIQRADTNAHLTGFSVFDQDHAMINFPQSPVPTALSGMLVNFYRLGSLARIAVAIDPALVTLEGGLITQQVSWDFTNQKIIAFDGGIGALNVKILDVQVANSMTVDWDSVNKFATWNREGSTAIILL